MKDIGFGTELVDKDGYPLSDVNSVYKWIRLARSKPKDPKILYAMYWLHKNHYMIRWSMSEAYKYFDKAAECGNPYAQYELGLMYKDGISPKTKNYVKAAEWLEKSANRGNVQAMKDIAEMYLSIESDKDRFRKSSVWLCRAFSFGDDSVVETLADMIRRNDMERTELDKIVSDNMPPKKAAALGKIIDKSLDAAPPAPLEFKGLPQELIDLLTVPDKAVENAVAEETVSDEVLELVSQSENGSADASYSLGIMYRDGVDVERDERKALSYFEKAADLGLVKAHSDAGRIWAVMDEKGCVERALIHYSYGIELNDPDSVSALKSLSFYYPRNTTKAEQYCTIRGIPVDEKSVPADYELLDAEAVVALLIKSRKEKP